MSLEEDDHPYPAHVELVRVDRPWARSCAYNPSKERWVGRKLQTEPGGPANPADEEAVTGASKELDAEAG